MWWLHTSIPICFVCFDSSHLQIKWFAFQKDKIMVLLNGAVKKTTVPGSFYFLPSLSWLDTWQPWSVFNTLDVSNSLKLLWNFNTKKPTSFLLTKVDICLEMSSNLNWYFGFVFEENFRAWVYYKISMFRSTLEVNSHRLHVKYAIVEQLRVLDIFVLKCQAK